MAPHYLWPIVLLNTKHGGQDYATACLWKALRDSLI
jgi:hypothetical protein